MPQGRRKVPFSAKQKRQQLQQKRDKKRDHVHAASSRGDEGDEDEIRIVSKTGDDLAPDSVQKINILHGLDAHSNVNRYCLQFKKESNEEIQKRKRAAQKPYEVLSEKSLEVSCEEIFCPGSALDLPKRPPWNKSMSKQQLDAKENKYFREYVQNIEKNYADSELSYFELNLETWRQLWRVLEMSEIILLIADIRHPILHFPPALYDYVTKELDKHLILVLNKIDLVPEPLVAAWMEYFKNTFPSVRVLPFASYAGMVTKGKKGKRQGKLKMAAEGSKELVSICEEFLEGKVDLSSWKKKIDEETSELNEAEDSDSEDNPMASAPVHITENDTSYYKEEKFKDGVLTLGFVGHPNVGKSSLLNAIMGKKVVSVSRTPGHTKHFQTIFLTQNVRLCDCPGLVFPSKVPKPLQVLTGCFPIAQLREPYSAIQYMAERILVPKILKLTHPNQEGNKLDPDIKWSAYDVCEAWATKRGYLTAKAARPDVYRAANNLLRMALDGRTLCLAFYPPGFTDKKGYWQEHPLVKKIALIHQGKKVLEEDSPVVSQDEDEGAAFDGLEKKSDEESEESEAATSFQSGFTNKFALLDT